MRTISLYLKSGSWFRHAYIGTSKESRAHEVLKRPDIKHTIRFSDTKLITLLGTEYKVGRDSNQNEIVLDDELSSRTHCQVFCRPGFLGQKWYIQDLNSVKGTFLNGKQLSGGKSYRIRHGDSIEIANTVMVVEKPLKDDA